MYQISLSSIREWVRDLIFGRAIPKRYRYMTVEFDKSKTPLLPPPAEKVIPSIKYLNGERIVTLPFDDPMKLPLFINDHKEMVYRYVLKRFLMSMKNNKKTVVLFQFGNSKKVAQIKEESYKLQLTRMLEFFVEIEDYESATQCRDLLQGIS